MKNKFHPIFIAVIAFMVAISSCKKNVDTPGPVPPQDSGTAASNAKDSALMVSKDFYLWYSQIPSNFNPQSYNDPNDVMVALRAYSKENGAPVDRWSFGVLKKDWNLLSGGFGNIYNTAAEGDFGFSVFFNVDGDLRVKLVERLSPAGMAGIQRGWRITKINGSTDITIANTDFIVQNIFYSSSSTFTFKKPDGNSVDISLTAGTYEEQPLYLDTTYNIGSKRIGYMVLNSFIGDTSKMFSDFQKVMARFASKNVTDIVVDLRYNGGGYVSVQEKLADYLAPNSANGSLMMKETFNDKHQNYNVSLYFKKTGTLNPNHVLFIVTQSTASASELLINNLKPYMDVKLIGPGHTDGKPVGFFPLSAGDWYVFPVSFRSTNSSGYGNYYDGFTPDGPAADGLDKNWGDPTESCLAKAIKYITTGTFVAQQREIYKEDPAVTNSNRLLNKPAFKGTVDARGIQ